MVQLKAAMFLHELMLLKVTIAACSCARKAVFVPVGLKDALAHFVKHHSYSEIPRVVLARLCSAVCQLCIGTSLVRSLRTPWQDFLSATARS